MRGQKISQESEDQGRWFRELRCRALLTQEELAARSGVDARTIRDIETGRTAQPRATTVRLLLDVLGEAGGIPTEDGLTGESASTRLAAIRLKSAAAGADQGLAVDLEARRRRVLASSGWIRTLRELYPTYPLVTLFGQPAAVCAFPAHPSEWCDLESALGELCGDRVPAYDGWSENFDPNTYASFRNHLVTAKMQRKWNGPAFMLRHLDMIDRGVRISCKPGRYFQSLATSEECDLELMAALFDDPDARVDLAGLPRRRWVHEHALHGDPVVDGTGRAAAVSVAMTIITARLGGGYGALLTPRSGDVATHRLFNHVAPSGIFAPLDLDLTPLRDEFSVRRTVLREYLEELYSIEEYEIGSKPVHNLEREPEIVRLNELVCSGRGGIYYTGVSVNLLTLRPEICLLLLVHDPDWLVEESLAAERGGRPWNLAWEWLSRRDEHQLPSGQGYHQYLALDDDLEPFPGNEAVGAPTALIPNAAAAISLGVRVARGLVGGGEPRKPK